MLQNNGGVYILYYKIKYCASYIITTLDSLCKQEQRDNRLIGQKVDLARNPKTPPAEQGQGCGYLECTNGLSIGIMSSPYHQLNYGGEVITFLGWARETSTRVIWNSHINNGNPI